MTDKTKKLTIKQTKFVKEYVKNDGNGKQAYKAAYGVTNDNTAAAEASTTLNRPNVKEAIELALAKHNITMDAAIAPIADGLHATRVQITKDGDNTLFDEVADHSTRLKASGMALKLMGADKGEQTPTGNTFLINNANFTSGKYVKD